MDTTKERVTKRDWHAVEGDVLNHNRKWGIVQYLTLEQCQEIDGDDATYPSRTVVIAEVTESDDPEQTREDAILLAAAPDLLAACEAVLSHLESRTAMIETCDMPDDELEAMDSARAAIHKARS